MLHYVYPYEYTVLYSQINMLNALRAFKLIKTFTKVHYQNN